MQLVDNGACNAFQVKYEKTRSMFKSHNAVKNRLLVYKIILFKKIWNRFPISLVFIQILLRNDKQSAFFCANRSVCVWR